MNPLYFKFVFEGQRIQDDETANSLGLENGDVIDVFQELKGGGLPDKKNIYGDANQILNILDTVSDCEELSELSSDENEEDILKPFCMSKQGSIEASQQFKFQVEKHTEKHLFPKSSKLVNVDEEQDDNGTSTENQFETT